MFNGGVLHGAPGNERCKCDCRHEWKGADCGSCPVGVDEAHDCAQCEAGFYGADECDELAMQGIKPWDDDAAAAIGALADF